MEGNKVSQEYDIPKDRRTKFSDKEEVCEESPYLHRKKWFFNQSGYSNSLHFNFLPASI